MSIDRSTMVLALATGNLGARIARALVARGATARAIVRPGAAVDNVAALESDGVQVVPTDFASVPALARASMGASCVVSALSGLRVVIVDAQTSLLDSAVAAKVPRFILSDFCIDFTTLPDGTNRNLDLRREFRERLDRSPIAATSILNGAFADLLTGPAPILLFKLERVLYWHDADQRMDFTTIDDTAMFTATAALDPATDRFLRIAGDRISARELATLESELTGKRWRLLRAGGLRRLSALIRVARLVAPGGDAVYPPWQGMQYLRNMFSGEATLDPLDNDRYPGIRWTTVREVLSAHHSQREFRRAA